jgi:hypothetical protein
VTPICKRGSAAQRHVLAEAQLDILHLGSQAHEALDTYFDFLKKTVSSFPSGGTDLGEKLKDQSVQNITAMHELVKRLSQAKDFEDALRIQTAFMHSQLNALGKQAASLGEAYTKEASGGIKMPFKSSLD